MTRYPFLVAILFVLSTTFMPVLAESDTESAIITVDAKVDKSNISTIEVSLVCNSATPGKQQLVLDSDGSHEFTIKPDLVGVANCTLAAIMPNDQKVRYAGDGGSNVDFDNNGCHFSGIKPGHVNYCQVHVEKEKTSLTVYKKWMGASDGAPNVEIHLVCDGKSQGLPLSINSDSPQTWELDVASPEGVRCEVLEMELDTFRADRSDCKSLLIMPGAAEECTLVNTKVVKRIQVLNRYGLIAMIMVMLGVGLAAISRQST